MAQIMTTKEVSKYLKLHAITICKYASQDKIPAIRIGRVWRFDKEVIDRWIAGGQNDPESNDPDWGKTIPKKDGRKGGTAKEA
ncbi:MAG: helix-turn-helix domain-containing protein [Pseudomonadota bacterium]